MRDYSIELDTLYYERDERNHDPNKDGIRYGQFKEGWDKFVNRQPISVSVLLDRLTYHNLGFRTAALHNASTTWRQNEQIVRAAYDNAVEIQVAMLAQNGGVAGSNRH